ncbi:hypothetical protein NIES4103_56330 [Nostoc sp. NIES-4103]|nr:hypothetical protein NIES4103_56330 [Nostoc sp. NIES-4103]
MSGKYQTFCNTSQSFTIFFTNNKNFKLFKIYLFFVLSEIQEILAEFFLLQYLLEWGDRSFDSTICVLMWKLRVQSMNDEALRWGDRPFNSTICVLMWKLRVPSMNDEALRWGDRPFNSTICVLMWKLRVHR